MNDMNKWTVRILGIMLIVAFMFLMLHLQKQLLLLQQQQGNPPATTTTTTT